MTSLSFTGRTWVFGSNISTDLIMPAAIIFGRAKSRDERLAAMMPNRAGWSVEVERGDIIVAGDNFGCGSSRPAPRMLAEELGIAAVVAQSFGRVFQRNAVNIGFPVLACPGVLDLVDEGDVIELDLNTGLVRNVTAGGELQGEAYPADSPPGQLLRTGGLRPFLEAWIRDHPEVKHPATEP